MTDEESKKSKKDFTDGLLWTLVGLLIGGVLAFKALSAMNVGEGEQLSQPAYLISLVLFVGPCFALAMIAGHLRDGMDAGKTTKGAYWKKMVGISIAALTLASITNIGGLVSMAK
ncbi:hypothetical protein [Streptomyces rubiginosohelvolus]|uniref:hypothetical protein n=1 Tax=Streptomyces rubiginosohelvolus TaxID=67362 RepID=UPI00344984B3